MFSESNIQKLIITEHKDITATEGPDVHVKSCLFRYCRHNGAGGGITVSGGTYSLDIEKSSFYDCDSTQGNGGGIYFVGDELYAYHTCFSYCESDMVGQAISAESTTKKNLILTGLSVNYCTEVISESGEESSPVDLLGGRHTFIKSNVTNCHLSMMYSAFHTDDSDATLISENSFENNTGNIVIGLEDIKNVDEISMVSFANNRPIDKSYGVVYTNSEGVIFDSVFVNNGPVLIQADVQVKFTFKDCVFNSNYGTLNISGSVQPTYDSCDVDNKAKPFEAPRFDTRYCWEITPKTLPAGDVTYWFFTVFFVFAAMVGYSTFIAFKKAKNPLGKVNANPLMNDKEDTYN